MPFAVNIFLSPNPFTITLNGVGNLGPRVILELTAYGGSGTGYLYQKYTWASRFDVSGGSPPNYRNLDINWNQGGFSNITYGTSDCSVSFVYSGNPTTLYGMFDIIGGPSVPVSVTITQP